MEQEEERRSPALTIPRQRRVVNKVQSISGHQKSSGNPSRDQNIARKDHSISLASNWQNQIICNLFHWLAWPRSPIKGSRDPRDLFAGAIWLPVLFGCRRYLVAGATWSKVAPAPPGEAR
jgi:hypothetical protein